MGNIEAKMLALLLVTPKMHAQMQYEFSIIIIANTNWLVVLYDVFPFKHESILLFACVIYVYFVPYYLARTTLDQHGLNFAKMISKCILLPPNNHITSGYFVLFEYITNNNIFSRTQISQSVPHCNKMAVNMQLLMEEASNFFSFVYDAIESVSALRNTLNTFWLLGDHDDPRDWNFSYNELCGANNPTISRFQQVKLVSH